MPVFLKRTRLPRPAEEVFRWHARPGAFERLAPPWENVRLLEHGGLREGSRAVIAMRVGPLPRRWVAVHGGIEAGRQFRDVQESGPFARWEHTHRMEPDGPGACFLEDRVEYDLPLGALGEFLGGSIARRILERMFRYRHDTTRCDLAQHASYGGAPMKIAVTGSRGLVGSALTPFLTAGGHETLPLPRPAAGADLSAVDGADAVVHLAGESIVGRWTAGKMARIRTSRVEGTRLVAEAAARAARKPRVLVCASAIGYYGSRGEEVLTEESHAGSGFLAGVCQAWEAAAEPARQAGIRTVHLRFGVILSPRGGALAKMLTPFRLGAGGILGSGRQVLSWISLDDAVGAIHHAIASEALAGPVNATTPGPVTNREFTKALGRVLARPTIFPVPAFAARLAFGRMADELLLSSARVRPERLLATGYAFRHPEIEGALRHLLGR